MHCKYGRNPALVFLALMISALTIKVFGQAGDFTDNEKHFADKGFTALSGSVHGSISGSVVLSGEIVVGQNHSAVIEPGTVLMMTRDARITVKGKLRANGDWKNQISFLPLRWEDYSDPPPLDLPLSWDHIRVEAGGELALKFTRIDNSRMGIVIEEQASLVRLDTVWLSNIEHSALKIGNEELRIESDSLIESYVYAPDQSSAHHQPFSLLTRTIPPLRKHEPRATYIPFVSSALVYGAGVLISLRYESRYRDLEWERTIAGKWTQVSPQRKAQVNSIEKELDDLRPVVTLGDVLMAAGAVGFVVTFPLEGLLSGGNK